MTDPRLIPIARRKATRHIDCFVAPGETVEERFEAGQALRDRVPRASHSLHRPGVKRADPVEILELQNRSRLPQLAPLRYSRMLESPFAFLRGSAGRFTPRATKP